MTLKEQVARAIYAEDWPEDYHADWDEAPSLQERYENMAEVAIKVILKALKE